MTKEIHVLLVDNFSVPYVKKIYKCFFAVTTVTDGGHLLLEIMNENRDVIACYNMDKIIGYEVYEIEEES